MSLKDFTIKLDLSNNEMTDFDSVFESPPIVLKKILGNGFRLLLWGDPIYDHIDNVFSNKGNEINLLKELLENISGHYYYLVAFNSGRVFIGNSFFSILPLYYNISDHLVISNSPIAVANKIGKHKVSKRFILENILFNYQLFNHSCYDDVSLLPSNCAFDIKNAKARIIKHTVIEEYFVASPIALRKSIDNISDLFVETSEKYFPDDRSAYTLTGGFDGRTIVSCALHYKKNLELFCFGSEKAEDTKIAKRISDRLNLPFKLFLLDQNYVDNYSLDCGLEFIENSNGTATFARAHYLYSAKILSQQYDYIITGNFGNEIFQTYNGTGSGVVIAPNLKHLFTAVSFDKAIEQLKLCTESKWLQTERFKQEWESLLEDLKTLPCFENHYSCLTNTQKLYIVLYEEMLRKYFGAEMVNQFKYIKNRTPFLDFGFLIELLKTEISAVNNELFVTSPFARYRGQVIYGHIIKKSYPLLGKMVTSWGYRPENLRTSYGKIPIACGYFYRKLFNSKKRAIKDDIFGVREAFIHNISYFSKLKPNMEIFNKQTIELHMQNQSYSREMFLALSQLYWYNHLSDITSLDN